MQKETDKLLDHLYSENCDESDSGENILTTGSDIALKITSGWQLLTKDCWPPDDANIVILHSFRGPIIATMMKGENLYKNGIIRDHTYWILAPEQYA